MLYTLVRYKIKDQCDFETNMNIEPNDNLKQSFKSTSKSNDSIENVDET